MRVFSGFYKNITSLGAFLLEILVYAWFVSAYLFLVYHFLNGALKKIFDDDRMLYAVLSLSLIGAQGFALERLSSALLAVIRRTQAFISVLFRLFHPHETVIRPANMPGVLVYRFGGHLFFANAARFTQRIQELIDTADPPVNFLLINAQAIVDVDRTGVEALQELNRTLRSRNVILWLCEVEGHFREVLLSTPSQEELIVHSSVAAALRKLAREQSGTAKNSEASD